MNVAASGRTWDEASSPASLRLTRRYEEAWHKAVRAGIELDPGDFLDAQTDLKDVLAVRLAILRSDLSLRWEAGDRVGVRRYLDRFPDLDEDTAVALIYEEFCLREDDGQAVEMGEYLARYPSFAQPLRRVLEIHRLIGSATTTGQIDSSSIGPSHLSQTLPFPEAGQTIAGFYLVEELGRGAFARVFLARERQLADRPVALKVTCKPSREPQALARLQHTHIVPVHSHRVDPATGLHLLCMPYFGRVTLARLLSELRETENPNGATLVQALDRLAEPEEEISHRRSACRIALASRSFAQAIAWWGARLAEALAHAHDRGVLHRDIKPTNVLVIDDGLPMLLDFNLARESVLGDDEAVVSDSMLGGTVDYMAPEHLEALAEGMADHVDGRSDIFELGVLLFETVVGRKPFPPPRRGHSVIDSLLRAAEDRRKDPVVSLEDEPIVPAPLAAVIRRCLEPDPNRRYQSATDLAADLRAVADDLPLVHAREPVVSRLGRRIRRNRRRLATVGIVLFAGAAVLGAYVNYQFERFDRTQEVGESFVKGRDALTREDFDAAQIYLTTAAQQAERAEHDALRNLMRWKTFWSFGTRLGSKLQLLWTNPGLEDLEGRIQVKLEMARLVVTKRQEGDRLLERSESLRFRLIGLGGDQAGAVRELKALLEPFYVLTSTEDWTKLSHTWELIAEKKRELLLHDVNELLFLWMVGVHSSLQQARRSPETSRLARDPAIMAQALAVCDRAQGFAKPNTPWLALRELLQEQRDRPGILRVGLTREARAAQDRPSPSLKGEPVHVGGEDSPEACFQWGLLCSSVGRRDRAIEWLQQAVWLKPDNYWYQFYLAYLEDEKGLKDDALDHYSAAVACQPKSPWVRFSRARLYRAKGQWSRALDDLLQARECMGGRPESLQVGLELGYLYQTLGDYARAKNEYRKIIEQAESSEFSRAARLNLANIAAESGREDEAQAEYERLLSADPRDHSARFSRALLNLRLGRPSPAIPDLDRLLSDRVEPLRRYEILSARAIAHLLLKQADDALVDAIGAERLRPTPSHQRLRQRAVLAAHRYGDLELVRPEEIALMPVGGAWLSDDLRAAVKALDDWGRNDGASRYRALLNQAIILSALGDHKQALQRADRALALAKHASQVRLIRARILHRAGRRTEAMAEIEEGKKLAPSDPGLLELEGALLTENGHPDRGLAYLDEAIVRAPDPFTHMHRARALARLGEDEEAVRAWSMALRADAQFPQAFLGRARCYIRLRHWDRALADLEQAAAWAQDDVPLHLGIMFTYATCLQERPESFDRWVLLMERMLRQGWNHLTSTSVPSGVFR
jgi:serine/threonine protein kinase/predicted Zn-dependent protease